MGFIWNDFIAKYFHAYRFDCHSVWKLKLSSSNSVGKWQMKNWIEYNWFQSTDYNQLNEWRKWNTISIVTKKCSQFKCHVSEIVQSKYHFMFTKWVMADVICMEINWCLFGDRIKSDNNQEKKCSNWNKPMNWIGVLNKWRRKAILCQSIVTQHHQIYRYNLLIHLNGMTQTHLYTYRFILNYGCS